MLFEVNRLKIVAWGMTDEVLKVLRLNFQENRILIQVSWKFDFCPLQENSNLQLVLAKLKASLILQKKTSNLDQNC